MELSGSSAIVTGAASGLGAATAKRFAAAGVSVFGLDLQVSIDKTTPTDGIRFVPTDVTDEEQVQAAISEAVETAPLRVAVNCAGIGTAGRILSKKGPHDLGLFRKIIDVNLAGTFNVMRLAAEQMSQQEPLDEFGARGLIVNTASVAAFEGQVGQIAYAASKGAVHSMTICAARDLAQFGIRVNTIAPGVINTPMLAGVTDEFKKTLEAGVPFPHRLGEPAEYADLAFFLASHDYLNGETVRMDGALRMAPR